MDREWITGVAVATGLNFLSFLGGCGKRLVNGESPGRSRERISPASVSPLPPRSKARRGEGPCFVRAARL